MRTAYFIAAFLAPAAVSAATLELELAPGLAVSNDSTESSFSLRGRAGVDFGYLTTSLVGFATPSGDPGPISHDRQRGGLQAWGVAAELRVHNRGEHQLHVGLGAGWGQLVTTQQQDGDFAGFRGKAAPYVEAGLGYRYVRDSFSVGVDGAVHVFHRVDFMSDVGAGPNDVITIGASWLAGVSLSVAFRGLGGVLW